MIVGLLVASLAMFSCGGGGGGYGGGGGGNSIAAPGAFSLIAPSPADTATSVGTTPTFAWTASSDATVYSVQVDTTGAFTGPFVINVALNAPTSSYSVPASTLSSGTTYHWRILAQNAYGQAVAGPRTFTT
ncbi:MAG TPA: hypothetical protein VK654_07750 [Nitrospirota bacterium]|nr:hypothetical protein [Nitrospirota bacterium]